MKKETTEFYELQRFRQWWIWVLLLGMNTLFLWGCVQQFLLGEQWGTNPMSDAGLIIVTAAMLLLSMAILGAKLLTYINEEGVYVKFFPFHFRYKFYDWSNIQTVYVRKYNPLGEFGGWGIRFSIHAGKAYTMSGNKSLQLVLMNGKKVLIGTRQPEFLAEILVKLGKTKD